MFACGRYEGIDARVVEHYADRHATSTRSRIGDYVLAGGEAAVLVMVEAVARLLPGVLGNAESVGRRLVRPRRHGGLLEGPVYTKPPTGAGSRCRTVLLSGTTAAIAAWRREQALARTGGCRPDLLG